MLDFSLNGDKKFTAVPKQLRIFDNGVFKILGLTAEYPALLKHFQNLWLCGYNGATQSGG